MSEDYTAEMAAQFDEDQKAAMMAWLTGEAGAPKPTMYATDPRAFGVLKQWLPEIEITSAGGACPFQAEGTLNGYPFYLRMRHGWAQLNVAHTMDDTYSSSPLLWSAGKQVPEFAADAHWADVLVDLASKLERTPAMRWDFLPLDADDADLKIGSFGWGATPEEAYQKMVERTIELAQRYEGKVLTRDEVMAKVSPVPTLMVCEQTEAEQEAHHDASIAHAFDPSKPEPEPLTYRSQLQVDTRVWPEVDPAFVSELALEHKVAGRVITPWAMDLVEEQILMADDNRREQEYLAEREAEFKV